MIEFQYFEGCPHSEKTLENLRELADEGFIDKDELRLVEVPDAESAEKLNFQGSPTILCNGRDIYTRTPPDSPSFSCRVYQIDGEQTGVLSKGFIKLRLEQMTR